MAVCPNCRYEYEPHVRVCADCGSELVRPEDLPPLEPPFDPERATQRVVSAYRGPDEPSVQRARAALEAEGIRAMVHSFEVSWYDDVFKHPSGAWGEVLVLEEDAARAAEVIDVAETGTIVTEEPPEAPDSSEPPARD